MKKTLYLLTIPFLILTGCNKAAVNDTPASEAQTTAQVEETEKMCAINEEAFISNFTDQLDVIGFSLENKREFESDGDIYTSYTISGFVDSAYIAYSTDEDDDIKSVYVASNPGAFTYFYATSVIVSINPEIRYDLILDELNITEAGDGAGIFVSEGYGVNYVSELTDEQHTFTAMFY